MGLVACLIPSFADVLSLIGNFTDVLTTFIFPAVMHIVFFRNRTSTTIMGLDMATLVVSVIIMVVVLFFRKGIMGDRELTDLLRRRGRRKGDRVE